MAIVTSGFTFLTEDIHIMIAGGCLQTSDAFTVDCADDGFIETICWDGGRGSVSYGEWDPFKKALYEILSDAIATQCASTIREHVAETAERTRERSDEHRAEMAMGK